MADNKQYKSILLLTSSNTINYDQTVSAMVLAKVLAEIHDTTVDIYSGTRHAEKEITRTVIPAGVTFLEKLDAEHFTITLNRNQAKVKEVKWEETPDKINLLVYTEKGAIDTTQYAMIPGKPHYDLVVSFGLRDMAAVKQLLGDFVTVWDSATNLNIDINGQNARFADQNFVYADCLSHAQAVIKYSLAQQFTPNAQTATELLAAILWRSDALQNNYRTDLLTIEHIGQLIYWGADLKKATNTIFGQRNLLEMKAEQELIANMKVTAEKVVISHTTPDTAKQLKLNSILTPQKNPLAKSKDAKVSFSLFPITNDRTVVYATSHDENVNLVKMFNQYRTRGDNYQCEFTMPQGFAQAQQIIEKLMVATLKPTMPTPESLPTVKETPRPEGKVQIAAPQPTADPLAPATEQIVPDPAPASEPPKPMMGFGGSNNSGGAGNPFGPL
jgi:hypothetical protein